MADIVIDQVSSGTVSGSGAEATAQAGRKKGKRKVRKVEARATRAGEDARTISSATRALAAELASGLERAAVAQWERGTAQHWSFDNKCRCPACSGITSATVLTLADATVLALGTAGVWEQMLRHSLNKELLDTPVLSGGTAGPQMQEIARIEIAERITAEGWNDAAIAREKLRALVLGSPVERLTAEIELLEAQAQAGSGTDGRRHGRQLIVTRGRLEKAEAKAAKKAMLSGGQAPAFPDVVVVEDVVDLIVSQLCPPVLDGNERSESTMQM